MVLYYAMLRYLIMDYMMSCYVRFSKAPKGNGMGATGSKNPRAYQNPCFSLLGMVLRTWVWF